MDKIPFDPEKGPAPASPVANAALAPQWIWRAVAIAVSLLVIFGIWRGSHTSVKPALPAARPVAPVVDEHAPVLPMTPQQVVRLKAMAQQLQTLSDQQNNEEAQKLEKMRDVAPVLIYTADGSARNVGGSALADKAADGPSSGGNNDAVLGGDGTGDSNTQFMSRLSQSHAPIAAATHIAHPATTLVQGAMIWATLETRIASDLPGMVRAVTSDDIYSEDGSQVLLPKGSRLIGQYNNGIAQGQNRVFVVWQRAIRPDHVDIQLDSPGAGQLGDAGIGADSIDHHFWQQFGTAALLSLIGTGAANAGVSSGDQYNSAAAYREGLANSFSQTAQNTLQNAGVIKPTIYVNQGDKVSVFVARDLDFYNELKTTDSGP